VTVIVNRGDWSHSEYYPPKLPLADIPIVFVNPGGERIETTTDQSGHASAIVELGASASIAFVPTPFDPELIVTYLALEPGDEVVFGAAKSPPETVVTMSLDFEPVPDASVYMIGACLGFSATLGDSTGMVEVSGYCTDHPFDIAVYRTDPDDASQILDFAVARDVVAQPGSSIQFGAWTTYSPRPIQVDGMLDPWGFYPPQYSVGSPLWLSSFSPAPLPGPTYSGVIHDFPIGETILRYTTDGALGWQAQWHRLDPSLPSVTIDVSERMLPYCSEVVFTPTSRALKWSESAVSTDHADMVVATVSTWMNGDVETYWLVRAPRTATTSLALPDLGPAYQHFIAGDVRASMQLRGYGGREWGWLKANVDELSFRNPDSTHPVELWSSGIAASP
jgi:hypothetical protein